MFKQAWSVHVPLCAAILCCAPAFATATYNYTGKAFDVFHGATGDTTANFLTASVTLTNPLASSMALTPVSPLSWSVSDGTHTVTNSTPNLINQAFSFATDASGAITGWVFQAITFTDGLESQSAVTTLGIA